MATRYDVSRVPLQGGYVSKRCPVRAQNDVLVPAERLAVSPELERRFARGRAFEDEVLEAVVAAGAVVVGGEDRAEREAATLRALEGSARVVVGGRLPSDESGRRAGEPDLLVRGSSGGWRAVDVKHHITLDAADPKSAGDARCSDLASPALEDASTDESFTARARKDDLLQLAHYQRMLETAGLHTDDGRFAGIVGVERRVVWYDLDRPVWKTPSSSKSYKRRSSMDVYDFEFDFRLDIIAVALEHKENPDAELLVVPVRISECDACPWFGYCMPILEQGSGDVSLLPRVGWKEWKAHADRGVRDRSALAGLDVTTAELISSGVTELEDADPATAAYADAGMRGLVEQIDMARAALGAEPAYRRRGVERLEVPRGDVEVDVDMENVEDGLYLWGTLVTDRSGTVDEGYRPFVTWGPLGGEAEVDNFREFWTWLTGVRRAARDAGLSFRAYCYSASAENRFLRSLGLRAGVLEEVEEFIASEEWVDLLRVFSTQLITGGPNGLKVVAPLAGFAWSADDAGGGDSMVRYDEATGADDAGAREAAREWLLTYNREDVEATLALRDWLETSGPSIPSIESFDT